MNADKDKHIDLLGSEANKNDSNFKIHFLLKPNIIWDSQTMISKQLIKGLQYQYNPPQTLLVLWRQKQNSVSEKLLHQYSLCLNLVRNMKDPDAPSKPEWVIIND